MKRNPARDLAAMRRQVDHVCPECDKTFEGIKTAKYCSNACRQRAKYRRSKVGNQKVE